MPVFNDADALYRGGRSNGPYINRGAVARFFAENGSKFTVKILGIFSHNEILVAPLRNSVSYETYANGMYVLNGWTGASMSDRMKQAGVRHLYVSPYAKVLIVKSDRLKFLNNGYHSSYSSRQSSSVPAGANAFELTGTQVRDIWDACGMQHRSLCDNLLWYAPSSIVANYDRIVRDGEIIRQRLTSIPTPRVTGRYADGSTYVVVDDFLNVSLEQAYRFIMNKPKSKHSLKRTDYKRSYVFCG